MSTMAAQDDAGQETLPANSNALLLTAAKQDKGFVHRAVRALALGVSSEKRGENGTVEFPDGRDKDMLVPFVASEILKKLMNPSKMSTLPTFMAGLSDLLSASELKKQLGALAISSNYAALRVKKDGSLAKVAGGKVRGYKNTTGDIILVSFDNVGFKIGGAQCGSKQTVHITYTRIKASDLRAEGFFETCREYTPFEDWAPYQQANCGTIRSSSSSTSSSRTSSSSTSSKSSSSSSSTSRQQQH